jgi:hypothetical protein
VTYCSKTEVRRRAFGGSGSGGSATTTALSDDELDALIEQASRFFDLECGVEPGYFEAAGDTATSKIIYGNGTNYLWLPPYVTGSLNTAITLPEGYTVPDFVEQNGFLVLTTSTGVLPPLQHFYRSVWSGWPSGVAVTVSARWGFATTPADVKMAVIELIINLWRETDPATLRLKDLEGQPLRERFPPRSLEVARKYRMKSGAVFV